MIRGPWKLDWERHGAMKNLTGPALRNRNEKLELLAGKCEAGMPTYVKEVREKVRLFTVAEDFDPDSGKEFECKLTGDCRKVNTRFHDLPWVPWGSPAGWRWWSWMRWSCVDGGSSHSRATGRTNSIGRTGNRGWRSSWSWRVFRRESRTSTRHCRPEVQEAVGLGRGPGGREPREAVFRAHTCLKASCTSARVLTLAHE